MARLTKEKVQKVESLVEGFRDASLVILADYRGLKVSQLTKLRKVLYTQNSKALVVKNSLSKLAFQELGFEEASEYFSGPSFFVFTEGEIVDPVKAVVSFSDENEQLKIKGGYLGRVAISDVQIRAIASLPSKKQLLTNVVCAMNTPIVRLVRGVASPLVGLVNVLKAIKDKKES